MQPVRGGGTGVVKAHAASSRRSARARAREEGAEEKKACPLLLPHFFDLFAGTTTSGLPASS